MARNESYHNNDILHVGCLTCTCDAGRPRGPRRIRGNWELGEMIGVDVTSDVRLIGNNRSLLLAIHVGKSNDAGEQTRDQVRGRQSTQPQI